MPTFIDAASATYPTQYDGNTIKPMEGVSLIPTFKNKNIKRPAPIFWEHIGNHAVRDGDWKLVASGETGPWELYNLIEDRSEMNNLAEKHPEKVEQMSKAWLEWANRCNVLPMNPK